MTKDKEIAKRNEGALTATEVKDQVQLIQQVMKDVMKDGNHYGTIPGCDKPTLLKPGAEKILLTFHFAACFEEMNVNETDEIISYRIKCILNHQQTGIKIGEGLGACNSNEKKYKTRTIPEKKANADEKLRIIAREEKQGKYGNYIELTIKNNPWDLQNTIYKMSCKRALVSAVLNSTAASDIFVQDLEDDPDIVDGKKSFKQPQQNDNSKTINDNCDPDNQKIEVAISLEAGDIDKRNRVKQLRFRWDPANKYWKKHITAKEYAELDKEFQLEVI
jgi:hypothetical protein